jgi:ABC-type lipopolysaccharide export system ATPase subunit
LYGFRYRLLDHGVLLDYRLVDRYYIVVEEQVICSGSLSEWID